ncbi:GNAT family N-acetyltransferase [bacterium]|nr:GNAT family N-acetyltransferase [bacterium]
MVVKVVSTEEERQSAFDLRTEVFVREQHVPTELELDELDKTATHVIAMEDNQVVGCGRIIMEGSTAWIGRVAVKKNYRGRKVGKRLMETMMQISVDRGAKTISLHAQIQVEPFYRKLGYIPHGKTFMDAGIEHIEMSLQK